MCSSTVTQQTFKKTKGYSLNEVSRTSLRNIRSMIECATHCVDMEERCTAVSYDLSAHVCNISFDFLVNKTSLQPSVYRGKQLALVGMKT